MSTLTEISEAVQNGRAKQIKILIHQALGEGIPAKTILQDGLLAGMEIVGQRFKENEVFIPQVLIAARAMNIGTGLLKEELTGEGAESRGNVILGTVEGDLHDIGKNLVKMMMEGKGLEVIDLGTDVSPDTFVNTAKEQNCQIIASLTRGNSPSASQASPAGASAGR